MKIKILVLSLITILMSCKKTQDDTLLEHKNVSKEITEKDLSKLDFIEFTLDVKTKKAIEDWQAYNQLQDVITNVKKGLKCT